MQPDFGGVGLSLGFGMDVVGLLGGALIGDDGQHLISGALHLVVGWCGSFMLVMSVGGVGA